MKNTGQEIINMLDNFEQEIQAAHPIIITSIRIEEECIKILASWQDVDKVTVSLLYNIERRELLETPLFLKRVLERFKRTIISYSLPAYKAFYGTL